MKPFIKTQFNISKATVTCIGVVELFWAVACPAAAPTYTLTDLGILPDYIESNAVAVNNAGQVAGNLFDSNGVQHAFIYSNGTMTVLGVVNGSDRATAVSMNKAGQIVGIMGDGNGDSVAFSYFNGTTVALGCSSCGLDSFANDVNDSGDVVGDKFFFNPDRLDACILPNTDLGISGSPGSDACAVNNSGQIVLAEENANETIDELFLYNGTFHDLGISVAAPGVGTRSFTINNSGQIIGSLADTGHPFLYANGSVTDLGPAVGNGSTLYDINNSGQIVGTLGSAGFVYYINGTNYLLSNLSISGGEGWVFYDARGINDFGQIVGRGYNNNSTDRRTRAFLLTPTGAYVTAILTSPNPGSTFGSGAVTFSWSAGMSVTDYSLWIGGAPGSNDIYDAEQGLNRSVTVGGLPTDGRQIYVRLWSLISGNWEYVDYAYTAFVALPAAIASPDSGAVFNSTTVSFVWNGTGAKGYALWVGNSAGANDIYHGDQTSNNFAVVSNLPTDGRTIYVRLWSLIGNSWQYTDSTYSALDGQPYPVVKADIDGDGISDLIWQDNSGGDRAIWFMDGSQHVDTMDLGVVPTSWKIATTGDFNGDGNVDIVWQDSASGTCSIWFMVSSERVAAVNFAYGVPAEWQIAATGDFNGDGQTDILWQNTSTGERTIWFMKGPTHVGGVSLGSFSTDWRIVGTGDFNGDGQSDILWEQQSTGACVIWFMNGASHVGSFSLGTVPTEWQIAGTGDFDGHGKPDIVWQNTSTGARAIWFMNGSAHTGTAGLVSPPVQWEIRNH